MHARCGTPHHLGLTVTSLYQYNVALSTLSIQIYDTPRHLLSLVCLNCPNAERTCAELSSRACYPHRTDYTTSCLCHVINPMTSTIGPHSQGYGSLWSLPQDSSNLWIATLAVILPWLHHLKDSLAPTRLTALKIIITLLRELLRDLFKRIIKIILSNQCPILINVYYTWVVYTF